MNDDCNSISIAPKTSNKSKNGTLSDSQIAKGVLLNNVDFNRERTNKRNVTNLWNSVLLQHVGIVRTQKNCAEIIKLDDFERVN